MAIVRQEGLSQSNIPTTPSGIEPGVVRISEPLDALKAPNEVTNFFKHNF